MMRMQEKTSGPAAALVPTNLGNLDGLGDGSKARDFVQQGRQRQQEAEPEEDAFVSGMRDRGSTFAQLAASKLGIGVRIEGRGLDEGGVVASVSNNKAQCKLSSGVLHVSQPYFRASRAGTLLGQVGKARYTRRWQSLTSDGERLWAA